DAAFLKEQKALGGPVVALLPGSRTQELKKNLPMMIRAAVVVAKRRHGVRFVIACLNERHRELAFELVKASGIVLESLQIHSGRTAELIRVADISWAVSGSVGLELMVEALPTVVVYKIRGWELVIARPFIKAKYISLVNLLADAELMPEYLTGGEGSREPSDLALECLSDPSEPPRAPKALADLRDRVAVPGASERAAERITEALAPGASPSVYPSPHERPTPRTSPEQSRG